MRIKTFLYDMLWFFGAFSGCHQLPERSFFIKGKQFPVCARCTGCFIGYAIGFFVYTKISFPIYVCVFLCSIMLIDWLIQYVGLRKSTNIRRLITGILCGVGYISIFIKLIEHIAGVVRANSLLPK